MLEQIDKAQVYLWCVVGFLVVMSGLICVSMCFYNSMVKLAYSKQQRKRYFVAKCFQFTCNLLWVILALTSSRFIPAGAVHSVISLLFQIYFLYLVYKFYALRKDYFAYLLRRGGQPIVT